jgi:hypothetical protein
VPDRGHSAKPGNKLSDRSSFSFLFSHALFFLFSARRRACCPPPRVLAPPHAGTPRLPPLRRPPACSSRRPLAAPSPSARPPPPHGRARHARRTRLAAPSRAMSGRPSPRPPLATTVSDRPLKGKCALGPFLSILVIECQHKWTYAKLWTKCKSSKKVCF